jgi:hypothetical protein
MRPLLVLLLALPAAGWLACDDRAEPVPPPVSLARPVTSPPTTYRDPPRGLSFAPGPGISVAAEHFVVDDPGTISSIYNLSGPTGLLLTVDLWRNPDQLRLSDWFERHLAFTRDPEAIVRWSRLSRHQTMGMIIERPRSPHAFPRQIAIIAVADQVLRITCHRSDDPAALELFQRVVDSLELGEAAR